MRYREFGVSTIESDRNRILEQSSHGLSDVSGVNSPGLVVVDINGNGHLGCRGCSS